MTNGLSRFIAKRVCLEPSSVVKARMLYKNGRLLEIIILVWRLREQNLPAANDGKEMRSSADAFQKEFANDLMLQRRKLSLW